MELMGYSLESIFGLVLLGFAVGAFGTLIGAGGGFLLAPILLFLYPDERPETISAISLAVVFFNAFSGSAAYAKQGRIDYRSGLWFALASLPGAVLGAVTTNYLSRRAFDTIFGVLLLAIGLFLLVRPGGAKKDEKQEGAGGAEAEPSGTHHAPGRVARTLTDAGGNRFTWEYSMPGGIGISAGVGYVSSLLGIGGGIIHVPALARLLRFPVPVATATSHFILALVALAGTVVHVATGAFHHGARRMSFLSCGVVLGAQLGAHFSHRVHGAHILRALAVALGVVGLRLLFFASH